jgi:hypothetical protein
MLLGLGRGPPGRGPPGRGASPGPEGPGRPAPRGLPGRGAPGPGRPADWPVPGGAAKAEPPAAPEAPGWPGRAPRGADPMPVAVELNGLLPGRGPGRGGAGVPAGGRGPPGPGRGPACLGVAGASPDGAARVPAPGAVSAAAARVSGWPCGNGTGGLARSPDSAGWPGASGVPAAGPVAPGLSAGPAAGAEGTAGPWPFAPLCGSRAATPSTTADTAAAGASAPAVAAGAAAVEAAAAEAPACDAAATAWPSWAWPARACAGCSAANASLSLRTTGASIVEDADRTNSPISWSLAITALLSTPNSFASSYTRTFATALPLLGPARPDPSAGRGSACSVRRQLLLFIAACSSVAHRNLSLLSGTVLPRPCRSCRPSGSGPGRPGPDSARYSASLSVPSGPGSRNARANARRRCACSKHPQLGCRYAPRPGLRAGASGTISSPAATTRSKSDLAARPPHPTQVRTAGACRARRGYRATIFAKLTVLRRPGHRARCPPSLGHR